MINLGSRGVRIAFAFALSMTLASCSTTPHSVPDGKALAGSRIGVISATADYARLGHVGMTVFNNEHFYVPIVELALDAKIEADMQRLAVDRAVSLLPVTFNRQALFRMYNMHDLDASMLTKPLAFRADIGIVQDELVQIAASNHVDRLLIVTKAVCPDRFGMTNQVLNGFGLYHGRYASRSLLTPGRNGAYVTMAYLCADVTFFDPGTRSVIASRQVTSNGSEELRTPSIAVPYWVKTLDGIPSHEREAVVNAFAKLTSEIAPSVAALLAIAPPNRVTAR